MIAFKSLCRDLLQKLQLLERVRGYHYLAYRNYLRRLGADSGLLFRFQVSVLPRYARSLFDTTIYVNPFEIRWGGRPPISSRRGYFVMRGDWDIIGKTPIEQYIRSYPNCRAVLQMFEQGVHYRQTEQYRDMIEAIEQGLYNHWRARGCRNVADVERYFVALNETWVNIEHEGYKSQRELGEEDAGDEIGVYIDRYGEFHKQMGPGHHRLVMARLLRIPQVPVVISGVHYDWAKRCVERFGGDLISAVNRGIAELACAERTTEPNSFVRNV